jgi:alpha-L-rhamnosidase
MELIPESQRPIAAKKMGEAIHAYKDHMSTGFHTTVRLMNQLTRAGMNDVAYQLINYDSIPSWGYTIKQGATTIWERWDGWVAGRKERDGFQDPGMNSFNHYAIGAVGEWMVRTILGINPDERFPAYKQFHLRPLPGGGLSYAKGSYDSIRGRIAVDWKIDGEKLLVDVTIPANTTAVLMLPAAGPDAVREGGRPIAGKGEKRDDAAEGVQFRSFIGTSGAPRSAMPVPDADGYARSAGQGLAVYHLVSGSYSFESAGFKAPATR